MELGVGYHKYNDANNGLIFRDGWTIIFNTEAWAAFDFADEGYFGSNPNNFRHGPSPFDTSVDMTNIPIWSSDTSMRWKWSGVYTP